jgi:hypothetical protein
LKRVTSQNPKKEGGKIIMWLKEKIFRVISSAIWLIFIISMVIRTILIGRKESVKNFKDEMNNLFLQETK